MKTCKNCNTEKSFDQFGKNKIDGKEYYRSYCKNCMAIKSKPKLGYAKHYYETKVKPTMQPYIKLTEEEKKQRLIEARKKYYQNNKEKMKAATKKWIDNNKDRWKEYCKDWVSDNIEQHTDNLNKNNHSIEPGVYMVKNQVTGERYIGQSLIPYARRTTHFSNHKETGTSRCQTNRLMQKAMKQYGPGSFVFGIIEHCEPEQLLERERYYINLLNPEYNLI
jgi:hypothetical protein